MNNLAYETFSREMLSHLQARLGPDRKVTVRKIVKNNNVQLDGIVMECPRSALSPTFYMEQLFSEYNSGIPFEEIVDYTFSYYERDYDEESFDLGMFSSFEKVKDRIAFKLVNVETNREMLKEVPYFTYLDLAIVFYCVLNCANGFSGSVIINDEIFRKWGIDKSILYEAASANTKKLFGIEIKEIQEVIVDMLLDDDHFLHPDLPEELREQLINDIRDEVVRFPVYVLSNRSRLNGAICMLYKEIGVFADQIDDDLFIIPSSVHEVLLVPVKEQISGEELLNILHEVNRDELDASDYLSDKIYYYNRKSQKILCK